MTRRNLAGISLGLGASLIFIIISFTGLLERPELGTLDSRFKLRGKRNVHPDIVIIEMDNRSIEEIGRWPWLRYQHAKLIDVLSEYQVKAIGFDVFFSEPSTSYHDKKLISATREAGDLYYSFSFEFAQKGRKISARKRSSLAWLMEMKGPIREKLKLDPEAPIEEIAKRLNVNTKDFKKFRIPFQSVVMEKWGMDYSKKEGGNMLSAIRIETPPLKGLTRYSSGIGFANINPDVDGTNRKVPLLIEYDGKLYPHLAFKMACDYLGIKADQISLKPGKYIELKPKDLPAIKIPINKKGEMLINYAGGWGTFAHLRYVDIWSLHPQSGMDRRPLIKLDRLKDKICFVGLTATGTHDLNPMPFQSRYPMVGIHANVLNTILNGDFLSRASRLTNISILLLLGIAMGFGLPRLRPWHGVLFSLSVVALYSGINFSLFAYKGIWLDMVCPLSVVVLSYVGTTLYHYLVEEREKRRVRNIFQRYVAPDVVNEILNQPGELALGGKRRGLSVLFADVRGFTRMSEQMEPEDVVSRLNEILTRMTAVIFKYKGTLDKFIGDCVMAFYGAPVEQPDHAERAVRTAIEMQEELVKLEKMWKRSGQESMGMGIGINTGEMVVGNIGSLERLDYTVIGDNVNLSERLESSASAGQILISENTYAHVKEIVEVKEPQLIKVKHKKEPVKVYEVIGLK